MIVNYDWFAKFNPIEALYKINKNNQMSSRLN